MKTTVELPDALLDEARTTAARDGTTLRALIEQGLRRELNDTKAKRPFKLRKASFKGRGLHAEVSELSWEQIRDLSYGNRGG